MWPQFFFLWLLETKDTRQWIPQVFFCRKYTRLVFSFSFNIVQKQLLIDGFKSERNGLFFYSNADNFVRQELLV